MRMRDYKKQIKFSVSDREKHSQKTKLSDVDDFEKQQIDCQFEFNDSQINQ